jgi:hypothetical protein
MYSLYPWMPNPPRRFRRNAGADARLRGLERALASGEVAPTPEIGYQLYVEHMRSGKRPEGGDLSFEEKDVVIDTKHGRVRLHINDAEHLHVENRGRGRGDQAWTEEWVINRVPFTFSQHAKLKDGKWIVDVSSHGMYREGAWGWEPSASLRKKFKKAIEKVVNDWAKSAPPELRSGDLSSVIDDIERREKEAQELLAQVDQLQLEIGDLYLRELRIRSGQALGKRMPSSAVLADAIDRMGHDASKQIAAELGVTHYDISAWARGTRRDGKATMAQRQLMFQIAKRHGLDVAKNPRPRRRTRTW